MFGFLLRRVALIVPTFLGVTLLAFALIHLIPGDPVETLSGERGMDPARRERLLHEFGLDRPLPVQYVEYVWHVLRGDLGTSLDHARAGAAGIRDAVPGDRRARVLRAAASRVAIGLPAGMLAAVKRNTVCGLRGDGRCR